MEVSAPRGYSFAAAIMLFFAGMVLLGATAAFIALLMVSSKWMQSGFESLTWNAAVLPVVYLFAMISGQVMGYLGDYMRGEMRGLSGAMITRRIIYESVNGLFLLQAVFFVILVVMSRALETPAPVTLSLGLLAAICLIPVWIIRQKQYPGKGRC